MHLNLVSIDKEWEMKNSDITKNLKTNIFIVTYLVLIRLADTMFNFKFKLMIKVTRDVCADLKGPLNNIQLT